MRPRLIVATLAIVGSMAAAYAQTPPAPQPTTAPAVKLEKVDELERDVIRLTAMVTSLQKENAELRLQAQASSLQTRAAAFVEKMKKDHPEYDVNPENLELTLKKPAAKP